MAYWYIWLQVPDQVACVCNFPIYLFDKNMYNITEKKANLCSVIHTYPNKHLEYFNNFYYCWTADQVKLATCLQIDFKWIMYESWKIITIFMFFSKYVWVGQKINNSTILLVLFTYIACIYYLSMLVFSIYEKGTLSSWGIVKGIFVKWGF